MDAQGEMAVARSLVAGTVSESVPAGDEPIALQAPDTVDRAVPFAATVTTVGPTTCWKADATTVSAIGSAAEIVAYDRDDTAASSVCPQAIVLLPRNVSVTFTEPGTATLRVRGRRVVGTDFTGGSEMLVEKTMFVR